MRSQKPNITLPYLTLIVLCMLVGISTSASAYKILDYVTISHIATGGAYGNTAVVRLDFKNQDAIPLPACATDSTWTFAFNLGTAGGGNATYMALLNAQATGTAVQVSIEDFCHPDQPSIAAMRWARTQTIWARTKECTFLDNENWIVNHSCKITGTRIPRNVSVNNGAVLTIENNAILMLDMDQFHIQVAPDSRIMVAPGGRIQSKPE